jgi:beta-lactamase superfamily II metal-dependent hydrolase
VTPRAMSQPTELVRDQLPDNLTPGQTAEMISGAWIVAFQTPDGWLHAHFLDVGQADAISIEGPQGQQILVDDGAVTSLTVPFLEAVDPELAVISVGADNTFGHPSAVALDRLGAIPTYRTDEDGAVEVVTDGSVYSVHPRP